jgi:signal transduction histidine kinase
MEVNKIIIVDDDEASRYVKAHVLSKAGYSTYHATTGKQTLDLVRLERPDLVLLDVKLPDMSGFDVCAGIKRFDPSVLVLQTSAAFVHQSDRVLGLSGGADSYLVEPMEAEELLAIVGALLRLRNAEQALRSANDQLEKRIAERTKELTNALARLKQENEERLRAEHELQHALKLDALGQLTGGISHDFNNLLTVVLASFSMTRRKLQQKGELDKEVDYLISHGERAANDCASLTRQLLAFSRKEPTSTEVVDINSRVKEFEGVLKRAIGESFRLEFNLAPDVLAAEIDPGQFEAAVLNLIVNARDAMQVPNTIRILTGNVVIATAGARVHGVDVPGSLPHGEYVTLAVIDKGPGIASDIAERVFEPFFTTKDVGKGTGLGLSQVHGFATAAKGIALFKSQTGEGTTVVILLPKSEKSAEAKRTIVVGRRAGLARKSVLLVEDNQLVRAIAADSLRALGCEVIEAGDGAGALQFIEIHRSIDILITDIVLPNQMNGVEIARQALAKLPGLNVLLISGYAPEEVLNTAQNQFPILPKPFTPDDLARAVLELCESSM